MRFSVALSVLCASLSVLAEGPRFSPSETLWYEQPATSWSSQTLPVGNGRIGGTVYGGDRIDRVTLNEISLWSGGANLPGNGSGYSYGPKAGKNEFGSAQPFGNLVLEYHLSGPVVDYTRALGLKRATALTEFSCAGTQHTRRCFVSKPDDVLVYEARVDKPGKLSLKLRLTPYHDTEIRFDGKDTLVMRGTLANGEIFEGRAFVRLTGKNAKLKLGGSPTKVSVSYVGKGDGLMPSFDEDAVPYLEVLDADGMEVYVSLATNYKEDYKANWIGEDPSVKNKQVIAAVRARTFKSIYGRHRADYQKLYSRMALSFGKSDPDVRKLPTDQRLRLYRQTLSDPELEALVYQYGRYVLIAGSRPGNLPLHLQGIWNDMVHAPWASDYHNNINIQMCYWGAEVCNLSECHLTFIDYIRAMEEPLHAMTVKNFGSDKKGWTTRISQNPWGAGGWVKWNPPVNAWYALHIWDHYLFTQDKEYLRETGYPAMKEICEFWETMLKVAPDGKLVSPNGWSHEWGPVEDGISHDQQLIWELFDNTITAARILGVDAPWAKKIEAMKAQLDLPKVSPNGYLQEWREDRPNMVSGHRHTSHLIGVFPGTMLWKQPNSKSLIAGAEKSLVLRGSSGDNRRSWTWPWRTALWARFKDADRAYEMVQSYIRWNCLDNLFGNHPPMQMDGTYGMPGGMSEMLVQSHAGKIELLPALPAAWKTGAVKGIRARGDITIDMVWADGKVTNFALKTSSPKPQPVVVVVNGETKKVLPTVEKK